MHVKVIYIIKKQIQVNANVETNAPSESPRSRSLEASRRETTTFGEGGDLSRLINGQINVD